MGYERKYPGDVARSLAARGERQARARETASSGWRRETFTMPRQDARDKAREWFDKWPKAAYMTEIESWREVENDHIEFTMRRLPTAD